MSNVNMNAGAFHATSVCVTLWSGLECQNQMIKEMCFSLLSKESRFRLLHDDKYSRPLHKSSEQHCATLTDVRPLRSSAVTCTFARDCVAWPVSHAVCIVFVSPTGRRARTIKISIPRETLLPGQRHSVFAMQWCNQLRVTGSNVIVQQYRISW